MFSAQTFAPPDLLLVGFLVILEGLLSADNALVLAIMVRHLPAGVQKRALLYGLGGAFVFRFVAIVFARSILQLWWLQAIGAAYLLYLPIKHFVGASGKDAKPVGGGFWATVVAVEIADIAFAVDSVLAAVSTVGDHPDKLWVVYTGAIIGVVMLRFAANFFIGILEKFPTLDHVAYVIVAWVGVKLSFMAINDFEATYREKRLSIPWSGDFPELPGFVFWAVLALIAIGGTIVALRTRPASHEQ